MEQSQHTLKTDGFDPKLGKYLSMMENNRKRLLEQLENVDDEMLDFTPNDSNVETIGTILDHIAAVEWSWIFEDIDGKEMDFESWKHAFANRESVNVDQRKGKGKKFYLNRLEDVRKQITSRLNQMTDEDLERLVVSSDNENTKFSIEWIFYHLINHEALHIGQISLLKRLNKIK